MTIYQAAVDFGLSTHGQMMNIHHYEFVNYTPNQSALQQATDYISEAYRVGMQASLSLLVSFNKIVWRRVDSPQLPSTELAPTAGVWNGTNTGDMMPPQNAMILQWKAATTYPRSSRVYISGFVEGQNLADGRPNATLVATCDGVAIALDSFSVNAGLNQVNKVAVKYTGSPRSVTVWNQVFNLPTNNTWYTQRRRREGVGS